MLAGKSQGWTKLMTESEYNARINALADAELERLVPALDVLSIIDTGYPLSVLLVDELESEPIVIRICE